MGRVVLVRQRRRRSGCRGRSWKVMDGLVAVVCWLLNSEHGHEYSCAPGDYELLERNTGNMGAYVERKTVRVGASYVCQPRGKIQQRKKKR